MNFCLVPEETVQKGCEASSVADLQNLAGQGPEGPDLTLSRKLDYMISKNPSKTSKNYFRAKSYLGSPLAWEEKNKTKQNNSLLMMFPTLLECRHLEKMPTFQKLSRLPPTE